MRCVFSVFDFLERSLCADDGGRGQRRMDAQNEVHVYRKTNTYARRLTTLRLFASFLIFSLTIDLCPVGGFQIHPLRKIVGALKVPCTSSRGTNVQLSVSVNREGTTCLHDSLFNFIPSLILGTTASGRATSKARGRSQHEHNIFARAGQALVATFVRQ